MEGLARNCRQRLLFGGHRQFGPQPFIDLDPARIAEARREAYLAAIKDYARAPPRGASAWLRELLDPAAAVAGFDLAQFLDTLPARPMARALAARARRKLLMKARP